MASNDQDSVFDQEKNPEDESIPSEDGRKAKNHPKFTSTPNKKSKLEPKLEPGDPALSTISSGNKTTKSTNRKQILSTENVKEEEKNVKDEEPENNQALSDSNELRNPNPAQNSFASTPKLPRTRSSSRSRHTKVKTTRKTPKNTERPRENYSEFPDFQEELNLGMDPLLACALLKKV